MNIDLDFLQTEIRESMNTEYEGSTPKRERMINEVDVRSLNNYEEARRFLPPPWGENVNCRNKYKGKWFFFSYRRAEAIGKDYEKTAKKAIKNSKLPFLELVAFYVN